MTVFVLHLWFVFLVYCTLGCYSRVNLHLHKHSWLQNSALPSAGSSSDISDLLDRSTERLSLTLGFILCCLVSHDPSSDRDVCVCVCVCWLYHLGLCERARRVCTMADSPAAAFLRTVRHME